MTKSVDRYISIRAIKQIQRICNPLQAFGIIEFTHDISFPKGGLCILSTNPSVFRHWYKHRTPTVRTDENGRTLDEGIYLSSMLEESFSDCAVIAPIFNSLCQANQSVAIMQREQDCQHLFSFSFQKDQKELIHWLINNANHLQNFVEYYKQAAKAIVLEAKNPANRITVPLINSNLNDNNISNFSSPNLIKLVHKDSKIPIFLSRQQSICLTLLIKGKSAKEIGLAMGLSYRTVQHYLERIKKILGCGSTKELIIHYGNQLSHHEDIM